jgi:DNA invertase Pin-like site-specific DNA recombinase
MPHYSDDFGTGVMKSERYLPRCSFYVRRKNEMKNYIFGYARVSTEAQNLDRQLDALKRYGVDLIFIEKMTGTKKDRPELTKLLDRITEGDTIVIESLSRLGRSTKDLIKLVELFEQKRCIWFR